MGGYLQPFRYGKTWLVLILALCLGGALQSRFVLAAGLEQQGGRRIALSSTEVACVVVEAGRPAGTTVTIRLDWEGQPDAAVLFLSASGMRGGHSIYVNGHRVGAAPAQPDERGCQPGSEVDFMLAQEIPIPVDALVKGDNTITLTSDADPGDGWTANLLYLEISGELTLPPTALSSPVPGLPELSAQALITNSFPLTSSYELTYNQQVLRPLVWYNVQPDGYTGTFGNPASGNPTPLLVALHGYGGSGQGTLNLVVAEANARGWFVVAPDMHGNFLKNSGRQAFAWIGAQHDVIDAIKFMQENVNINTSRIYVAGGSMGGQTASVMATKYPDIFAAAAPWKGISNLGAWYNELNMKLNANRVLLSRLRQETAAPDVCNPTDPPVQSDYDNGCGTPVQEPFEYQRRSPVEIPQNGRLVPFQLWHDQPDELVVLAHSVNLRNSLNAWNRPAPAVLDQVNTGDLCDPPGTNPGDDPNLHCYNPPPLPDSFYPTIAQTTDGRPITNLFNFLSTKTRSSQPPALVTVRTDESKSYYWLNVSQSGSAHWSEIRASYSQANKTVTAVVTDSNNLTLGFNLGSQAMPETPVIPQAGIGLPQTTYLVKGGGNNKLQSYASGYFTATVSAGQGVSLTISAISIQLAANPGTIKADGVAKATITVTVKDRLNNPAPNGTLVSFTTGKGTLSSPTASISGGQGQASVTLTSATTPGTALVTATVGQVSASISVLMTVSGAPPKVYLPVVIK